jgi:predicted TIM-barrel fold metal-dependent hydrolase
MELRGYLSPGWREFIGRPDALAPGFGMSAILPGELYDHPVNAWLPGSRPSDPAWLAASHLTPAGVEGAVLCAHQALCVGALPGAGYAADVARAVNDWTIDRWLSGDGRFAGLVTAATQVPENAAAEIRRAGRHPRMVGVLIAGNGLGKTLGHPVYDPVYEAAEELGLPVVIHTGIESPPNSTALPTAGGFPATFAEYYALRAQPLYSHLLSMVTLGVFERHRGLRALFVGAGMTWLPQLVWRMDSDFRNYAAREAPWLRRYPSEQVAEQVRVSTYSLRGTPKSAALRAHFDGLDWMGDVLCYASGHPRWDADAPDAAGERFPAAWQGRILHDNAQHLFRWPAPSAVEVA